MQETLSSQVPDFTSLGLSQPILKALTDIGYETPSPIQARLIPHMTAGQDVVGQAQTGTGKTAAFALPLLSRINLKDGKPQVLVLTPTRELAIQVAEAFHRYAARIKGFHVAPIYGGQDYSVQLRQLKRGMHVVVGTPGRVMDHMRRGTLRLEGLNCIVLDEADEMLRMGFIDDVEWILKQAPAEHQTALFSATMPPMIRSIAKRHLKNPVEVTIELKTTTAQTIRQRLWMVSGVQKLEALTRILESEPFDAMLVFVKTRTATGELAEKLEARGYAAAALNGDIPQNRREKTIDKLKTGKIDILVATDVAARGLDVGRISHVINYDIPYDTEAYVHRIGRTGRAGKSGEAILFVQPRERRMLRQIEKATRQNIEIMKLPSRELINDKRIARFKERITDALALEDLGFYYQIMEQYRQEHNIPAMEIAAALARLLQGDAPLLLSEEKTADIHYEQAPQRRTQSSRHKKDSAPPEEGMERFRLEIGYAHGVKPGNIVGAIANEAGLDPDYIGRIDIFDAYSTVDLPTGMPRDILRILKKVWVCGQQMHISRLENSPRRPRPKRKNTSPKAGKRRSARKKR